MNFITCSFLIILYDKSGTNYLPCIKQGIKLKTNYHCIIFCNKRKVLLLFIFTYITYQDAIYFAFCLTAEKLYPGSTKTETMAQEERAYNLFFSICVSVSDLENGSSVRVPDFIIISS